MAPPGFQVPYPDLSVLLGGGGPPAPASSGAAAAAPVLAGKPGELVVTEVNEADSDVGYLAEITVVDDQYIFIVGGTYGEPTVLVSSNGTDFVRRKAPGQGLRAVQKHGSSLYIVGEYGLIAGSSDLGKTWEKQDTGVEECLFGITQHQGVLWVCGDEGYLARPGSGAWDKVDLGTDDRISDVVSIGNELYLLGFSGSLRIVNASGEKVHEGEVSDDGALCSLIQTKTGAFILCGDSSYLGRSEDGRTYEKIDLDDLDIYSDLENVAQLADGTIVVVGDDSSILLSNDDGKTWRTVDHDDVPDDCNHLWCVYPFGAGALIGGDDGSVWKLAPKGDKFWADKADEFEGEVYAGGDDEDDSDDDDDDEDADDDDADDDDDEDDEDDEDASAPNGGSVYLSRSTDELEVSVRTANCLQNAEIRWIGQLVQKTEADLLGGNNFGAKSLAEIKEILSEMELHLGMNVGSWTPPD